LLKNRRGIQKKKKPRRRSTCAREVEDLPTILFNCITAMEHFILLREPMSILTPQQSRTKVVLLARITYRIMTGLLLYNKKTKRARKFQKTQRE